MPGRPVRRRKMPLEPKQLWDFHFRRDRTADIAEHVVLRLVDLAGFGNRAMIHPPDEIPPVVTGAAYRARTGDGLEHHERAGRIESEPPDRGRRNGRLRHRGADRSGAGGPDFRRRLFDDTTRLMPNRDRMAGG